MKGGDAAGGPPLPPPPKERCVPGTQFCIDSLTFKAQAYFVSHAHTDHYSGLSDRFDRGTPVYCSECTCRVLIAKFPGLDGAGVLHPLPMREAVDVMGVRVTLIDANHCPGAVQFIFEMPDGTVYIHSGDMRFSSAFKQDALLEACKGRIANLYLDTTYCNPRYTFPSQAESVSYVADRVREGLEASTRADAGAGGGVGGTGGDGKTPQPLFLISTYSIGKEKILKAVASACGCKVFVTERKMRVLGSLRDPELDAIMTTDPGETRVHVVRWGLLGATFPYFQPGFDAMESYRAKWGASKVVGFVPTGWMYEMKKQLFRVQSKHQCEVHLVPYSEHSNYDELREYVRFLR